jgi:hypothetical protein
MNPIYNICTASEWREAERAGVGLPKPRRNGSPASAISCWSRLTPTRSATS